MAAGPVTRATSKAVCEVLSASPSRYGITGEILIDSGTCFTGGFGPQPVEVLFDRVCRENGISHRHTAPRSPTTTGKIERFHPTQTVFGEGSPGASVVLVGEQPGDQEDRRGLVGSLAGALRPMPRLHFTR